MFCRAILTLLLLGSTQFISAQNSPLFKLLPSSATGVSFNNRITVNDTLNILNEANIYNGGGVGIGDFNNDGLQDIYLAGNMVSNKFYLNKGAMKFTDVTQEAGVGGEGHWCTGVSVVDINNDGWLDIYISASFREEVLLRTNLLYINQHNNKNGIPVFKESAAAYGLADEALCTQGYFFDYDRDGDLDLYQVVNALYDPKTPIRFRPKVKDGTALNTDKLYRNNGNNSFTNVSKEAGILIEGWGHAASISDFNNDGWPDIYVANDFVSNDLLYINNRNGTFSDKLGEYFKHTGWNAMGTDYVDINNDGFPDLLSLEMLPENNLRKKRMLSGNEYYNYFNSEQYGYTHQYVRNVLQLNSGATPLGHPVFSDIGFLSGVYQTDWSWCPLVADFDNDGLRDLVITNGLPRDVTDLDYVSYDNGQGGGKANLSLALTDSLPVVHIPNYAFKNLDGINFQNTSTAWGLNIASFSNGAAYADLDNDGDLDFVVNNIDSETFLYENTSAKANVLTIKLVGQEKNRSAMGSTVTVYYGNLRQYYEHQPCRGYLSTVDDRAHFALGNATSADSVKITWPDGKTQLLVNVSSSKMLTVNYQPDAGLKPAGKPQAIFRNATKEYRLNFKPTERDFIDYNIQTTLPHKLSQYGPGIAVGDIDNNGFEDFYLGGSSGNPGKFFLQDAKGIFTLDSTRIVRAAEELHEEMGLLFFDADNDGDLDLYAVGGSYEVPPNHAVSHDRLFLNNGKGRFTLAPDALPAETANGSCVRAADFDRDGDLDLFVGGRVVSGAYPTIPRSYIFQNKGGKFTDVTEQLCPSLPEIGMVTDALFSDFNNDGRPDLILTGEWMPLTFLQNTGKGFERLAEKTGVNNANGWWNSLAAGDFDNDGDIDYVAGNLGLNSNYKATVSQPMTLIAKDLDANGSLDAMLFCYMKAEDGTQQPFPMHTKDDLISQLVSIRRKFPTYRDYGLASMNDMWKDSDRKDAIILTANEMRTGYFENKGAGRFEFHALSSLAQAAPVYGMLAEDINNDGNLDLVMIGNDFGMEPYSGRHDAFNGLCMTGDGKGEFNPMTVEESGLFVKGDAKGLARLHSAKNEDIFIATQNQDSLVVVAPASKAAIEKWLTIKSDDQFAEVVLKDGRKRRVEFYYGSGFLSQSSRKLPWQKNFSTMTITNSKGIKRRVP
jgi:hypothetical protein